MYGQLCLLSKQRSRQAQDVVVALFEHTKKLPEAYSRIDREFKGVLSAALNRADFSAKKGVVTTLYRHPTGRSKSVRLYVLGLGDRKGSVASALRIASAKLLRKAGEAKVSQLKLVLMAGLNGRLDAEDAGRAVADGLSTANFEFNEYKGAMTKAIRNRKSVLPRLSLTAESPICAAFERGLLIGESVNVAREIAATPPNVANVDYLVRYCRKMATQLGLRCTVITAQQAERLNMGGLLAVGKAGSTPPALVCLEYRPPKNKQRHQPILLVGKGVTFDTGGYSIKSASGMEGMKYDKCGGTTVIGAMHAIARLKPSVPVVGLVAAAENMVDKKAYRPGDIISMFNGVTVEVTNTDAEGRLILGDALAYGFQKYQPRAVIDLATLTGGVVVALGSHCAGAFCNDPSLGEQLMAAGQSTGERLWFLPLWEEHRRQLHATHADIVNSAGREAHPIQGAAFLSHFVDTDAPSGLPKTPWAHLDIAGVSDVKSEDHPFYGRGPTGFGVRLLVQTIESWPSQSED